MKKFLRRMNRGIALAAVLVIGLAVFLTAEGVRFSGERDRIQERVTDFLADAQGLNVFPEEYNAPEAQLPEDVRARQVERAEAVRGKYCAPHSDVYQWDYLTESLKTRDPARAILYDERYAVEKISRIRPQGSGYASAELDFVYTAEYAGWPEICGVLGYFGYPPSEETDEYRLMGKEPESVDLSVRMRYTVDGTARLEFVRRNGEWMIRNIMLQYSGESVERVA